MTFRYTQILLLVFLVYSGYSGYSQTAPRKCLTHYMTELNKDKFPKQNNTHFRAGTPVYKDEYYVVPVVVHIIHDDGPENISDARVVSQINVLNEDFGHYGSFNHDDRGEDIKIRFCLASLDPDGNPTTGIVRVKSSYTNLESDKEMLTKDLSRWDAKRYLNIWVVRSIDGESDIQGYSYTPANAGGPSFDADGIVITYKFFGKISNDPIGYKLGRTTTHEVGHYFDLIHPWGGDDSGQGGCSDDDGIEDTPNCSLAYDNAIYPHCTHPVQCNNVRMIENFMDYSTDGCMKLFTPGQGDKMKAAIVKYRPILVSYANVVERGCTSFYDSLNNNTHVRLYPNPVVSDLYVETHSNDPYSLELTIWDMYGRIVIHRNFTGITKGILPVSLDDLRPGFYILKGSYADGTFEEKFFKSGRGF